MDTNKNNERLGDIRAASVHKTKLLKKKIRKTALTTLQLFIAWTLMICLGSLLFIYIEQCVREHPRSLSDLEIAWKRTCDMVRNTTTNKNGSAEAIVQNNITIKNGSTDTVLLVSELDVMCRQDKLQIAEDDRRCVLDMDNFSDYVDFCYSIAFTIGKLRKVQKALNLGKRAKKSLL